MKLQEALDIAVAVARRTKERQARKEQTDLNAAIFCFRGDHIVSEVYPSHGDNSETLLLCANMSAAGFDADIIVVAFETWGTESENNPLTGEPWKQGDLQAVVEQDGLAKGQISEAVIVLAANRAGDVLQQPLPYRIVRKRVVWQDIPTDQKCFGGYFAANLIDLMAQPTVQHLTAYSEVALRMSPERVRALQDTQVAALFSGHTFGRVALADTPRAYVVLRVERDSVAEEVIKERHPDVHLMKPSRRSWLRKFGGN